MSYLPFLTLLLLGLSEAMTPRSCQNESNMSTLPDTQDISVYYLCLYGRAEKFRCPPGYRFDQRKPACVPKRIDRLRRSIHVEQTGHRPSANTITAHKSTFMGSKDLHNKDLKEVLKIQRQKTNYNNY